MADMIDEQSRNIEALSSVEGWDSDAGRAFNEVANGAAGRLKKAFERYDEAAKAIGTKVREGETGEEFASELHRAQQKADKGLQKYREAHGDYEEAHKEIEKYNKKCNNNIGTLDESELTDYRRWVRKRDAASQDMRNAGISVGDAKEIFDDAGDRAAKHIKNVIYHDDVHDPGGFWNTLADWADELSAVAAVLSVAALVAAVVFSGGTALVLMAALASAGALAGHAYDMFARGGKLDLLKLTLDTLGIIPGFGALRGLTAAAKGARAARASEGVWQMFTNGKGTQAVNWVAKGLNKVGLKGIPAIGFDGEVITRYIKGAGIISAGIKMGNKWLPHLTGDEETATTTNSSRPRPSPQVRPSPTPFLKSLEPAE